MIHQSFKLEKNKSLGVDRSTDKKLKQGKYPIDVRVDLHGSTLDEAFSKLEHVVNVAYSNHKRCILVITGKGLHSESGRDTIKSSIHRWLALPTMSSKIIKYTDAHRKHGGEGAVYILLKRSRQ